MNRLHLRKKLVLSRSSRRRHYPRVQRPRRPHSCCAKASAAKEKNNCERVGGNNDVNRWHLCKGVCNTLETMSLRSLAQRCGRLVAFTACCSGLDNHLAALIEVVGIV